MDYRQSKTLSNDDFTTPQNISRKQHQLNVLNALFFDIMREIENNLGLCGFFPDMTQAQRSVFELGTIDDHDVMQEMLSLDGYIALHKVLKSLNYDFHFQMLPSAGMMRPQPILLFVVEAGRGYGSGLSSHSEHMYPLFSANDNIDKLSVAPQTEISPGALRAAKVSGLSRKILFRFL